MSDPATHPARQATESPGAPQQGVGVGVSLRKIVWSVAVSIFLVQLLTGVVLMAGYSPTTTSAWASVWHMQTQAPGGWLIRGLHHFASDALLISLAFYAVLLLITWAYVGPNRVAWWTACGLLALGLGLALTGHVLPWDQTGYWGTVVRTNILAKTPLVGDALRRLLLGGSEMGNMTLTRMYTLHVMVLPILVTVLVFLRSRASLASEEDVANRVTALDRATTPIVLLAVLLVIVSIVWNGRLSASGELLWAPANANATDFPARPEWHTVFLYEWLKYFEGSPALEVLGAIVAPTLAVLLFLSIPYWRRAFGRIIAHGLVLLVTLGALGGAGWLTYQARRADARSESFQRQRERARARAARALELAAEHGVSPSGPLELLANDHQTRGPELFAEHCAACHRFNGHDGLGRVPNEAATSSDLAGFGSRVWILGFLRNPMGDDYFGRMKKPDGEPAHTRMAQFIADETVGDEDGRRLNFDAEAVAAYLACESISPGPWDKAAPPGECDVEEGARPFGSDARPAYLAGRDVFLAVCNECHSYDGQRSGTTRAPEMLGYGSVAWIARFIGDPSHDTLYRSRGREPAQMPAFSDRLSERDRGLIARWLHGSRHRAANAHGIVYPEAD